VADLLFLFFGYLCAARQHLRWMLRASASSVQRYMRLAIKSA
jgi:hypothetical protein